MKVRVIAMLVLLGSIFTLPARTVAQEATPAASPVAEAQPGDLPALMMTVADLEAAGQRNSRLYSGEIRFTPAGYASAFGFDPDTTSSVSETLATARFLGVNTIWWQILDPESGQPIREIMTYIERYASPEGAAAGFAAIAAASVAADAATQIFPGDRLVGDQMQIVGVGGVAASGTPSAASPVATASDTTVWRDVMFQTGPINAGITVTDFTGRAPTIAEMEALAAAFLTRIEVEQGREAPGLAPHALRLIPSDSSFAGYETRDGTTPQFTNETEADWQKRAATLGSAVTVYRHDGFVPFGVEGFDDDIFVSNRITRFSDEQTAAAFMADLPGLLQGEDATVRERDLELGDETLVADAATTSPTGEVAHRVWVFVRDGADVDRISVTKPGVAPDIIGVEALAAAALNCLNATDWCPAVRVPSELLVSATPSAPAVATPVSSIAGTPVASTANASCAEHVAQDQAAMTLTPGDLGDVGLNDFGLGIHRYFTAEDDTTYYGDVFDRDVEDIRALLTAAGHRSSYGLQLVWPAGEEPAPSTWPAAVTTAVYAFADAAGAREGFALLTGDYPAEPADEMSLSAPIGDASTLTRSRAEQASPTAGASQKLTLRFLRDCVVVELIVGVSDPERAELLTPATIEALGQRLVERVDNVLAGQSPRLDGRLLRVQTGTDAESSVVYGKLGGETVRTWRESDQAFLQRVLRSVAFNSLLERAVTFTAGTDEPGDDLLLTTTLLRFPDEKRASAWIRDTVANYEAAPSFSDVAELAELPQFGDESLGVTLTNTTGGRSYARDTILVRVDDVVAYIYLQQPSGNSDQPRSVATLAELAAAQAACLEQSEVCAPIPVPEGLAPPVATPVS